jgi:glutathione synthase/RimK-type ligase-like ATP-grasp enzyme
VEQIKTAVISQSLDLHAAAVVWGLRRKGVDSQLLTFADCAVSGGVSLSMDAESSHLLLSSEESGSIDLCRFSGFWLRRTARIPDLPDELLNEDAEIAKADWSAYLRSLTFILAGLGKYCLNDPRTKCFEDTKPYQLQVARRLGFRVPKTYVGNDFGQMRATFCHENRVAYKTLTTNAWTGDRTNRVIRATYTRTLQLDAGEWRSFRVCPAIVQEYVEKAYEVRATVIGKDIIAVGINSQSDENTRVDWRGIEIYKRKDSFFFLPNIPTDVRQLIAQYCSEFGLEFCALDFIVTPTGDWVFLEGNNSGQFLFCESMVPETMLLDRFCNFFAARSGASGSRVSVTLNEFEGTSEGRRFLSMWRDSRRS